MSVVAFDFSRTYSSLLINEKSNSATMRHRRFSIEYIEASVMEKIKLVLQSHVSRNSLTHLPWLFI